VRRAVHQPHIPAHSDPAGQEGEGARLHPGGGEGRTQAQGVLHRGTHNIVEMLTLEQGVGSGSVLDSYSRSRWIRIRILKTDSDPGVQKKSSKNLEKGLFCDKKTKN